jgi:ATP-binding cassette subfamily B protein
MAWMIKDAVNLIIIDRKAFYIPILAALFIILSACKGLALYKQQYLIVRVGNEITADYQVKIYAHMLQQGSAFFDYVTPSDFLIRFTNYTHSVKHIANVALLNLGRNFMTTIALSIVVLTQDIVMFFSILLMLPLLVAITTRLSTRSKSLVQTEIAILNTCIRTTQETCSGIRVVESCRAQKKTLDTMRNIVTDMRDRSTSVAENVYKAIPASELLTGFGFAFVVSYCGYAVIFLGQNPGSIMATMGALIMIYQQIRGVPKHYISIVNELVKFESMSDTFSHVSRVQEKEYACMLAPRDYTVTYDNLVFGYTPDTLVCKGLSFTAKQGEVTAIVGESGSGKTTAFSLLERFYNPENGRILIGEMDIRDVTFSSLRGAISFVPQEPFLFQATILENIQYGTPHATREDAINAAKDAGIHSYIEKLPLQYDTFVETAGQNLSVGQRQRIVVARALIQNCAILLLDEVTSALDTKSEQTLIQSLRRIAKTKTVLLIAHRLSTVHNADRIHVMENGRIVESGNHQQLIEQNGIYANLYMVQND